MMAQSVQMEAAGIERNSLNDCHVSGFGYRTPLPDASDAANDTTASQLALLNDVWANLAADTRMQILEIVNATPLS